MGKEMLDLLEDDAGQILGFADIGIIRERRVHRYTDQLFIAAMLVFQIEHADRATADHATGDEGAARDDQRIQRVPIGRQCVRDEPIIGRIAHRRVQNTVHEQRTARLVEFIFHRFAAGGHFDDDVETFGRIVADTDFADIHARANSCAFRPRQVTNAALR